MKPNLLRAAAIGILLAASVWAADPWTEKSPDQWNKKEVGRILRDSPWTKVITVPTTWARTGGEKFGVGVNSTIRLGGAAQTGSNSGDKWDPQNHNGYFLLRWASSRTIRAAEERLLVLKGTKPRKVPASGSATARRKPAEEFYELELVWDLFARFPTATEVEAAKNSALKPSKVGVEFHPRRVEYRRGTADTVMSVVFYFPKKTPEGEPYVLSDEDRIDFFWRLGPSTLQARFNPQRMVARGAADY